MMVSVTGTSMTRPMGNSPVCYGWKIAALMLLVLYLALPLICFSHPCELTEPAQAHGTCAVDGESHGTDSCETACCCAEHVPFSAEAAIPPAVTGRLVSYERPLVLSRLIRRIFIPPRNFA